MKKGRIGLLSATGLILLAISVTAPAAVITLDFEGIGDLAFIEDFYNGGTDSQGNSGEDFGVSFGTDARGLIDRDAGGSGNFANEPTPDTTMFFLAGSSILNFAPGFDTGFSFFYTTSLAATVTVWDGLDAIGSLLGEIDLFQNNTANNCEGDPQGGPGDTLGQFCNWDIGNLAFSGIARSIDFSGTANQVGFDTITFGSTNPIIPPPDPIRPVPVTPASPLLLCGLLAVGSRRRRG